MRGISESLEEEFLLFVDDSEFVDFLDDSRFSFDAVGKPVVIACDDNCCRRNNVLIATDSSIRSETSVNNEWKKLADVAVVPTCAFENSRKSSSAEEELLNELNGLPNGDEEEGDEDRLSRGSS